MRDTTTKERQNKCSHLHGHMDQLSWTPNLPTGGGRPFLWNPGQIRHSLLLPVGPGCAPDDMMDVLLEGTAAGTTRDVSEVLDWIYSISVSIIRALLTPSSRRRLSLVVKWQERRAAICVVVPPPGSSPECFPLHNICRWAEMFATAKTKQAPSSIFSIVCPQMLFPKVSELLADAVNLDLCRLKQGFTLSL